MSSGSKGCRCSSTTVGLRIELGDGTFEGTVSGYWDVANIRDIIGAPTTQNGNAANFTIKQFEAGMAEFADGDYDADSGLCNSFSIMFRIRRAAGLHREREHSRWRGRQRRLRWRRRCAAAL